MQVNKVDNNQSFGQRLKFDNVNKGIKKLANELGCEPEVLSGAASVGTSAISASVLESANYSGLEKVLPINVSIPLGITASSVVGYKSLVSNAEEKAEKEIKNAKRRGEEVPEQPTDPNFVKVFFKDMVTRVKNILK